MAKAWTKFSLGGAGLQSTNLALARQRKSRTAAYLWWVGFPVGAHALYLRCYGRALLYATATAATVVLLTQHLRAPGLALGAVEVGLALYDLYWVDQRLTALNKWIRMQVSLQPAQAPPTGYRGRYTDDGLEAYVQIKEQERAGHQPLSGASAGDTNRPPSFAEQEAQLRTLSLKKKPPS